MAISHAGSRDVIRTESQVELRSLADLAIVKKYGWNVVRTIKNSFTFLILFQVCLLGLALTTALGSFERPINQTQLLWLKIVFDVIIGRDLANE